MDTIFALASGSTHAGVAVIRISGAKAAETLTLLARRTLPNARQAVLCTFIDPTTEQKIDHGLATYFQAPASFTGEDVVEYYLHGGKAVINGMIQALTRIEGCRLAEPGEFTRRAFENGKIDLTEAEAVGDLIAAETEAQRIQALDQLGGALAKLYSGWAEKLKSLLAHQEADIEFPEDDLPQGLSETLKPALTSLLADINAHLNDNRRGERLRDGVLIAIIGAPNAGKSSLLNALAERDAAIVSDEAGTTRDIIEVHLDLGGYPVVLADTAGLRHTENKIEAEGIRRAENIAQRADLKIALFDATQAQDEETLKNIDANTLVVYSKKDKIDSAKIKAEGFFLSSTTGDGMDDFLKALTDKVGALFSSRSGPALTRERHRLSLQETAQCLERGLNAPLPELAAEDMRLALRALGKITGKVHVEDLLDKIFKDFCIGK